MPHDHADRQLIDAVRTGLRNVAQPDNAGPMQAYMKSTMPFLGCTKPLREQVCKPLFKQCLPLSSEAWLDTVAALWREATHREERYCAVALLQHRQHVPYCTQTATEPMGLPRIISLLEEMVVEGAWWDHVDELARSFSVLLQASPEPMRRLLLEWAACDSIWKRRIAILCQLPFKEQTDFTFMQQCIAPSLLPDALANEFFLRKGIGWALRNYARVNPQAVAAYVRDNEKRLSPLTRREALKHILNERK